MPVVTATFAISTAEDKALGARIEAAMHQAIMDAAAVGISDPDAIRARMLAARQAVKDSL